MRMLALCSVALVLSAVIPAAVGINRKSKKKGKLSAAQALAAMGAFSLAETNKLAAGPATPHSASLPWKDSHHVEEIDRADPDVMAVLKSRTRFSMPLVIRGSTTS